MKTICSWSGGKDSCYAFMKAINDGYEPSVLLNVMNENGKISRSHGLPRSILEQQAAMMELPLHTVASTWNDYESNFIQNLQELKVMFELDAAVFGDIDIQAHRDWEEKVCAAADLQPLLPLWQQDRKQMVYDMIDAGIEAMIVSCNTDMGEAYLGKAITRALADELDDKGIDACGENGEYHTAVLNCPLFKQAITVPSFTTIEHEGYCFIDWSTTNRLNTPQ